MLKKVLKMAAAKVALLILKRRIAIAAAVMAMGTVLTATAASAGPNLIRNADFSAETITEEYTYTYDEWVDPDLVQAPWNSVSSNVVVGPNDPHRFTQFSVSNKTPNRPNMLIGTVIPYSTYPAPNTADPYFYQVINGIIPGHVYEVSFMNSGQVKTVKPAPRSIGVTISPIFAAMPWRVTFKGASGTQTQISSTPPTPPPNAYNFYEYPMVKTVLRFLAGDTTIKLGFIPVTWDLVTWELPCIPCYTTQESFLSNLQMVDVGPVAAAPTLTVQKAMGTGGRINAADQFKVSILNATTSAVLGSGSTAGTGSTITGGLANITGDTTTNYKVVEEMVSGSASNLAQYSAALSCTNANSAGTQFAPGSVSLGQNFPLLAAGDQVSCTVTNTPKAPSIRLTKALGAGGRANNADQFTVLVQQRLSTIASGTSTGSGGVISAGSTGWTNLVAGTSYNLGEVMASGSASNLAAYTGVLSCSNALAGSSTVLPTAPGAAFTPTYGDVLDCTLTNTPKPATLTVTQKVIVTAPATFNPPLTLSYTGTNGWTLQKNNSTVLNTVTTGATQTLAALKLATTLTVAVSTSEIGWKIASIRCTDTNAAVSGNPLPPTILVSSTNNTIVIPANLVSAGAALQCAVIGSRQI